jgi:hypothetical protein
MSAPGPESLIGTEVGHLRKCSGDSMEPQAAASHRYHLVCCLGGRIRSALESFHFSKMVGREVPAVQRGWAGQLGFRWQGRAGKGADPVVAKKGLPEMPRLFSARAKEGIEWNS